MWIFLLFSINELEWLHYLTTFLKSWIHISDNIASLIGTYRITRGGIGIAKEKWYFPLPNNFLDVFAEKDLLGLEQT